jgi:hypothetical protein
MKWMRPGSGVDWVWRRVRAGRAFGVAALLIGIGGSVLVGALVVAAPAHAADEPEGVHGPAPAGGAVTLPIDSAVDEDNDEHAARRKHWGLMFDLGSMHGGMLSLVYRPAPWLRLHAGAGTNAVSPGYRAGVTLAKVGTGPSLNIEAGHFLPGDMNGLLKILVGTGYRANSRLEDFDYDFVNLHAGWDIETGALTFFARGGASVLWTRLPALPEAGAEVSTLGTETEPFWLVLPSVAFGFVGFL